MNGFNAGGTGGVQKIDYSEFLAELSAGQVQEVVIQEQEISGSRVDGGRFKTFDPGDSGLIGELLNNNV